MNSYKESVMGLSRKEFNKYDWSDREQIIFDLNNNVLDISELSMEMSMNLIEAIRVMAFLFIKITKKLLDKY